KIIRLLGATLRMRVHDPEGLLQETSAQPWLFAFWHNRILMFPYFYQKYLPQRRCVVMISRSKDGQLITDVAAGFGIQAVRGSSSKKAMQAYREILRTLNNTGKDGAVTPDGPRGPRYRAHPGIILLAQMSQRPSLPVTCHFQWKIELKSWDKFQLPLPFSRCDLHLLPPLFVSPAINEETKEKLRAELEKSLGL
ncbi:MAG: lysophospholipid acyltransferase family protein, partial [bacterium]